MGVWLSRYIPHTSFLPPLSPSALLTLPPNPPTVTASTKPNPKPKPYPHQVGVRLSRYIPHNSFLLSLSPAALHRALALVDRPASGVRWVGEVSLVWGLA